MGWPKRNSGFVLSRFLLSSKTPTQGHFPQHDVSLGPWLGARVLHRGAGKTQHQADHDCWELEEAFNWAKKLFQATDSPVHVEHFESDRLGQSGLLLLTFVVFAKLSQTQCCQWCRYCDF